MVLESARRVHLVGIGGSGMSALARVLLEEGLAVSGSDLQPSPTLDSLRRLGARVHEGHQADNVAGVSLVIVSSAVRSDNPELMEARRLGIPVLKRAEALGELTRNRDCVAVAGTHGKTTTTSMIALVMVRAGLDPTFVVGGEVADLGVSAHLGRGRHIVVEADEYDESFLKLWPRLAVLTNVEADHLDFYGDMKAIERAFEAFIKLVPEDGLVVANADNPLARQIAKCGAAQVESYGFLVGAKWRAVQVRTNSKHGNSFRLLCDDQDLGVFRVGVPGLHNVSNALATLAVSANLGIDLGSAGASLADFHGARRRFERKGEVGGIVVVDDYAHHPTEVRATLQAAREQHAGRLWCVFQPHTYHRTKTHLKDFAASFELADRVLVLDVYMPAGREVNDLGISSRDLVRAMAHRGVRYAGSIDEALQLLRQELAAGDLVLTLGAGDVYRVGERLLQALDAQVPSDQAVEHSDSAHSQR